MKLELDENLHPRVAALLAGDGHDVETVRSQALAGIADEELFEIARREGRALVTLDLDFSNPLRFPTRDTAGTIVFRVPRPLLSLIEESVRSILPQLRTDRLHGRLWIVEPGRIREHGPED